MNIKISEDGVLHIERVGQWIRMDCMHNVEYACGHDCPLFGDPGEAVENEKTYLRICENRKLYGAIIDERKAETIP